MLAVNAVLLTAAGCSGDNTLASPDLLLQFGVLLLLVLQPAEQLCEAKFGLLALLHLRHTLTHARRHTHSYVLHTTVL